jgi:DeoR/GlpR family transcriptional regulator of sugar metabolism
MIVKRIAPHSAIVSTLKRYGTVDVDFIATQIGRNSNEVESYVQSLANAGVVRSHNGIVSLIETSKTHPAH